MKRHQESQKAYSFQMLVCFEITLLFLLALLSAGLTISNASTGPLGFKLILYPAIESTDLWKPLALPMKNSTLEQATPTASGGEKK